MPIKPTSYYRGKRPKTIRDVMEYESTDEMSFKCYWDETMFYRAWGNNLTEYEEALIDLISTIVPIRSRVFGDNYNVSILQSTIYNNFGLRKILKSYYDMFEYWDGTSNDYSYLLSEVDSDILKCICNKRYKWGNLMKSMLLEFNPLWNVDAHEETVRTLEQDGTITNRKRGTETEDEDTTTTTATATTDTLNRTGTETSAKTGTERTLTDETTEESKRGTDTTVLDYGELTTNNTTDETSYTGSEITSHQSAITSTESATTTESETFYPTRKTVNTGIGDDNQDEKTYSARKDTLKRTGTVETEKDSTETLTHNTTDSIDHDSDVTLTHNTSDTLTRNTSDNGTSATNETNVLDKTNTLTHNTDDTETRDLTDTERTIYDRHGNIGTTTTTKLLNEFREFINFDIVEIIAHDIVNSISESVY